MSEKTHPLPKVDHTLVQLAGAIVFSKLDAAVLANTLQRKITKAHDFHHTLLF